MSKKSIDKIMRQAIQDGSEKVSDYPTGGHNFYWCCDCNLRHIIRYEVIRGKRPCDDMVRVETVPDFLATDLMRFYDKNKTKRRKKR